MGNKLKKLGILFTVVFVMTLCMVACQTKKQDKQTEIADVVQIPENGVITKAQFEAFAGTDRIITFEGSSDGIVYHWKCSGNKIKNPQDMNLGIEFVTDTVLLDQIKSISGNAAYALGMKFKGTELITVPDLTIYLPEHWDADKAVLCKEKDGIAWKMSDVIIIDDDESTSANTTLSTEITEFGDTYFIVAGSSVSKQEQELEQGQEVTVQSGNKKDAEPKGDNVPDVKEQPAEQNTEQISGKAESDEHKKLKCTISINCSTILKNMDNLKSEKMGFVPSDGWILSPIEVEFSEGDSVFDVLLSVCRSNKIHMEHSYTPAYGSEYIEGIHQLYERDCGELSGWTYRVNGWSANYGCDQYLVSDGDLIQWLYTCDLGKDL